MDRQIRWDVPPNCNMQTLLKACHQSSLHAGPATISPSRWHGMVSTRQISFCTSEKAMYGGVYYSIV